MPKIKKVLQHDETDCGAACLSIIFEFFRKSGAIPVNSKKQIGHTEIKPVKNKATF